jgi:hypothetical protein
MRKAMCKQCAVHIDRGDRKCIMGHTTTKQKTNRPLCLCESVLLLLLAAGGPGSRVSA